LFSIFDSGVGVASATHAKQSKLSLSERLYRDLQAHRDRQAAIMAQTGRAQALASTPLAEYLLQIIGDNETRQAEVLGRMAASLQDALSWSYSARALPDRANGPERAETVKSMQELLRLEQARVRSARRLAKAYTGIGDGLEQALLEASATAAASNVSLLRLWLRNFKAGTTRAAAPASSSWQSAMRSNRRTETASDEGESPTLAA
jgi:hypothetical protein